MSSPADDVAGETDEGCTADPHDGLHSHSLVPIRPLESQGEAAVAQRDNELQVGMMASSGVGDSSTQARGPKRRDHVET